MTQTSTRWWSVLAAIAVATPLLAADAAPEAVADTEAAPDAAEHVEPTEETAIADGFAWQKLAPATVDDLRQIQDRLQAQLAKASEATVVVTAGGGSGSGVIVSPDGYVLTAGHVSGRPGRQVRVTLANGKTVRGVSLGNSPQADAGMIKIEDDALYPFVPMGHSGQMRAGSWVFAIGHPGGLDEDRGPVVRLGRVIARNDNIVWTDCKLLGGDSGGPLYDMDGNVVGIHSRISMNTEANYHAPVDAFTRDWDRLIQGEVVMPEGQQRRDPDRPFLGVGPQEHALGAIVGRVVEGSAADKAGIRPDDIITTFDGKAVQSPTQLIELIGKKKIGDTVKIELIRAGERLTLEATLGEWIPVQ